MQRSMSERPAQANLSPKSAAKAKSRRKIRDDVLFVKGRLVSELVLQKFDSAFHRLHLGWHKTNAETKIQGVWEEPQYPPQLKDKATTHFLDGGQEDVEDLVYSHLSPRIIHAVKAVRKTT